MNARDFFIAVRRMREAQRKYFKTRSVDALRESILLERAVDAEVRRVDAVVARRSGSQVELWGEGESE